VARFFVMGGGYCRGGLRCEPGKGVRGYPPQAIFKFRGPEMVFLEPLMRYFFKKCVFEDE